LKADPIAEMERLYKKGQCRVQGPNPAALDEARQELVKLQRGDEENLSIWREMIALSQVQFDTIYQPAGGEVRLHLGRELLSSPPAGSSRTLRDKGIARESEGALAVFFDDIPQLKEHPALSKRATARSITPPPTWPPWRTVSRPGTPTRSSMSPMPASNSISSSLSPRSTAGIRTPR
jgi:arginyl-tRNA synthetase